MPRNVDELHRKASDLCLNENFDNAMALWRQMLELEPDDERAIEGIRRCEKLLAGEPAGEPAADPGPERALELPMEDLGEAIDDALSGSPVEGAEQEQEPVEAGQADEAPEVSVDEEAANELRRRVDDLLEEARDFADTGNQVEAEQTLVRVLILDEENEQAHALQKTIQESRQSKVGSAETPILQTTDIEFDLSDEEAGEAIPTLDTLAPVEPSPEAVSDDDKSSDLLVAEAGAALPEPAEETKPEPARKKKKKSAPAGLSLKDLPPWATDRHVLLGAGAVLLVVALVLGFRFIGGEDPEIDPTQRVIEKLAPKAAKPPQAAAAPQAPPKDPALLVQQALAAVEAEDWAVAVLAYNDLLKQQPDHVGALAGLPIAIERYRAQQEWQQEWGQAKNAFESGSYREALRMFYHMESAEVARLDDFKFNGWYNLGVVTLQRNECLRALDHFDEALEIRAGDATVLDAMSMADACLDAGKPSAEANALRVRSLKD